MATVASGTFEVTLAPLELNSKTEIAMLGRLSLDKMFYGDLKGTSKGEMLTAGTLVDGSAGYVAIERFEGTLQGRSGSFVLQHSGVMTRGEPDLVVTVVPDSGGGELEGLSGKMEIEISDGKHFYEFVYNFTSALTKSST